MLLAMGRDIYVETRIVAPMDVVWRVTQDPAEHQRWDLRFTEITYDQTPAADEPQVFRYALRLGPRRGGLRIAGTGRTLGEKVRADGTRTSALGFGSADPRSLIDHGTGWWRYVPDSGGVRFLTGYDYEPRWGLVGRCVDRWLLRPWIGWATAWSFDRLRLWLEHGVTPETARTRWVLDMAGRTALMVHATRLRRTLPAMTVALAATALPPLPGSPRAGRCLRRPANPGSPEAAAPATLSRVQST